MCIHGSTRMRRIAAESPSSARQPTQDPRGLRQGLLTRRYEQGLHALYDPAQLRTNTDTRSVEIQASSAHANALRETRFGSRIPTPPPPHARGAKDVTATQALHDLLEMGDNIDAVHIALANGADPAKSLNSSNRHCAYFIAERLGRTGSAQVLLNVLANKCVAGRAGALDDGAISAGDIFCATRDAQLTNNLVPDLTPQQVRNLSVLQWMGAIGRSLHDADNFATAGDSLGCERCLSTAQQAAAFLGMNIGNDAAEIRMQCAALLPPSI